MIYEKKLLNTELKYDAETEKLYRFNKWIKCWTLVDPGIDYNKKHNVFVYNRITIDKKMFQIHRLIYYMCNDNFDIFNSKITIDHKNVDHCDNQLENLRTATMSEQARNRLNYNGELVKGFSILKTGIKRYRGYYYKNGKTITKCFLTEAEARKFYTDNTVRF